ncbi:MAG: hypothetical protein RR710_07075, partial [Oscillospiraceae bacterium]
MKLSKKVLPVLVAAMVLFSNATISFAGDLEPGGGKDEHFFQKEGWYWEDWLTSPHDIGMTWEDLSPAEKAEVLQARADAKAEADAAAKAEADAAAKSEADAKAAADAAKAAADSSAKADAAAKAKADADAKAKFWDKLYEQINNAKSGEYIDFDALDYREMPVKIMQALNDKKVGLRVKYDGKVQFTIPADGTLEFESNRLFYRLSDLCAGYNKIENAVDAYLSTLDNNNPPALNGNNPTTAGFTGIDDLVIDFLGKAIERYNDLTYLGKQLDTTAASAVRKYLGLTDNVKDINVSTVALATMTNLPIISDTHKKFNSMFDNYSNFQLVSQLVKADQLSTATSATKELAATVNVGDGIKIVAGNGTGTGTLVGTANSYDLGDKKLPATGTWGFSEETETFISKELTYEWSSDNNDKFFKSKNTKGILIKEPFNNYYYYFDDIDPSKLTDSKADELKAAIVAVNAADKNSPEFNEARAKLDALRAELAYDSTGVGTGTGEVTTKELAATATATVNMGDGIKIVAGNGTGTGVHAIDTNDNVPDGKKPPADGNWGYYEEGATFNSKELPAEWGSDNNDKFFKSKNTKGIVIKNSNNYYHYFD